MTPRAEAEEHLRVIRTLMERATIYRAISAPTALIGGLLALVASAGAIAWLRFGEFRDLRSWHFTALWLGVLALTLAVNTFFVWREARERGASMISPAMRLALRAVFPVLLTAGVLTFLQPTPWFLSILWMLLYGLALLATAHFSPRSLRVLGWAFLISGLVGLLTPVVEIIDPPITSDVTGCLIMGATFGLFHIIYAIAAWPRGGEQPEAQ